MHHFLTQMKVIGNTHKLVPKHFKYPSTSHQILPLAIKNILFANQ